MESASPAALEACFRRVAATRMDGVALCNPALGVEALGFRPWGDALVGVLVTPWSMLLICLPGGDPDWAASSSGTTVTLDLPSGAYDVLTAHEPGLGPYLTGSLFSPMFGFADMDQARAVAAAVMDQAFAPAAAEPQPAPSGPAGPTPSEPTPSEPTPSEPAQPRGLTRRGLFTALLSARDGQYPRGARSGPWEGPGGSA
jgi:[NiFe] hydrogenase assembly HybE family chaperone